MTHAFVGKWAVRYECQRKTITASVTGLVLVVTAIVLDLGELHALGIAAAGGAVGAFCAALVAIQIERKFKD